MRVPLQRKKKKEEKGRLAMLVSGKKAPLWLMAKVNWNINSTPVTPTSSHLHPFASCPMLLACHVPERVLSVAPTPQLAMLLSCPLGQRWQMF